MRCLIEVTLPAEAGNSAILDGSLMRKIQANLQNLKPEASYFFPKNGQRSMITICNVASEDQIVSFLEPFWLDFKATVNIYPVMVPADLEKAQPAFQKLVQSRSH